MRPNDRAHAASRDVIEAETGRLVVVDPVVAEVDYLLVSGGARGAEEAFIEDLLSGAFSRELLTHDDLRRALEIIRKFREHDIGIADAVQVAVAERLGIRRILTLDRRHFRLFRLWGRTPFAIQP